MKHPFARAAAVGTVLTFALTACGGGGTTGGGGDGEELQPLTIGVIPIAPSAPVQLALDEGIFEKHGLDVTIETAQGGAAMLPAVSGGSMDIGVGNPLSVILAKDQGLDMKILSGYSSSMAEGEDITGVAANQDAGIASWADLAGKRVAVNTINGQGDLTIKEAVSKAGGDPDADAAYAYVLTPDVALAAYVTGERYSFRANFTNEAWTRETPREVTAGTNRQDKLNQNYEGTFGGGAWAGSCHGA